MKEKIIYGSENIKNVLIEMINSEKQKLIKEINGKEDKSLFVALNEMVNIFGRISIAKSNGDIIYPEMKILNVINGYKAIFDTIMENKNTNIEFPNSLDEYIQIKDQLITYFKIANLIDKALTLNSK